MVEDSLCQSDWKDEEAIIGSKVDLGGSLTFFKNINVSWIFSILFSLTFIG
jgi:hypothetical protein